MAIGQTDAIGRSGLVVGVATTVVVEAVMVWRFGWSAELPAYLVLGAVAVAASVIDLATRRIPRALIWPAYPLVAGLLAVAAAAEATWWSFLRAVIAMVVLSAAYLALALAVPHGLGIGDAWLAGCLSLGLGWLSWPAVIGATVCTWCLAAVIVMARHVARGRSRGTVIPLAPFLLIGAMVTIIVSR